MSTKPSEAQQSTAPGRSRRKVGTALLTVGILAALGWATWEFFAPKPPAIDLSAFDDPEVVDAISRAQSDVRWHPWSADHWGTLGLTLHVCELDNAALTCLREAEKLNPADVRWPYYQGWILVTEKPDDSLPCFERAVACKADLPSRLRLADIFVRQDRLADAEAVYRQILTTDPTSARATLGLGQIALRKGNWREAITQLTRVTGQADVRKAAYGALAQAHQQAGDPPAAAAAMKRFSELADDPPWFDPYLEELSTLRVGRVGRVTRATSLINEGKLPAALQLLEETVQKYPDYLHARLLLGRTYRDARDYAAAERHLRIALTLDPNNTPAHILLARLLESKGATSEALTHYWKAVEIKPDGYSAYYSIGECLLREGDKKGAIAAFQRVVRIKPDMVEGHLRLAEVLIQEERDTDAEETLNNALRLAPENAEAKRLLDEVKSRKIKVPKS